MLTTALQQRLTGLVAPFGSAARALEGLPTGGTLLVAEGERLNLDSSVRVCRYADEDSIGDVVERLSRVVEPVAMSVDDRPRLTPREQAVLELLRRGLTSADIAATLYISVRTVHGYRSSLYRKLGARSQAHAVARALEVGLLKRS